MQLDEGQKERNWKAHFFTIWGGQVLSLLGSELVQFALVWELTRTTGSATVLATAAIMGFLPTIFIAPFAGALVDRWNRRLVMIVADSVIALATALLAVLYALGLAQNWHIYVLMFIRATGGTFHWPAMQASTTMLVPARHLSRIAGLNMALQGATGIIAPPLGALLLELLLVRGTLAIDVGTAMLAIVALLLTTIPEPERETIPEEAGARVSVWADMRAGWRYIWGWPGMVVLIVAVMVIKIAMTPAFSLLPLLVKAHFGGDAAQLSLLEALAGVGMVLGGIILGAWGGFQRKIYTAMMGMSVLGFSFLVMGLAPPTGFWLALASGFVMGLVIPLIDGPLMAIMQGTVTPDMQGRVFTTMFSLVSITSPLALAIAGPVADWIGLQAWYVAAAILCGAMGVAGFLIPAVVHIEENVGRPGEGRAEAWAQRAET